MGSGRSRLAGTAKELKKGATNRVSSPRHPGHRDPEPTFKPEELLKKDSTLNERLKGLRAQSRKIEIHENFPNEELVNLASNRKVLVTTKTIDPSAYNNYTPDEVPPGKLNMEQLVTLFTLYQHKSMPVEELAEKFKIDSKVAQDLVDSFALFSSLRKPEQQPKPASEEN
ncbi:hypothetical protein TrispH2_001890 [Trichoplax sp. H2]|uniref:Uncharacterized protein n=1 Tax=Trichoplax adhaerens TaxID=10228 RepID=B3RYE6_TRIAD|nr:predicted protein [Trichoplax adhaerens]EDV24585.1 predicted protein [Trichoplax adhaerens]RDD45939.1 hypothetical protein TrispH2_001890 [Trichoplax sp. H2]|eukprot:XP_002112475.1 predicted protein [Trichoplax adhaerens]